MQLVRRDGRYTHGQRFAQRRRHVRPLRARRVRVLWVGRDLQLDVVVLVELGQRAPFRPLERVQQLLDLGRHLPAAAARHRAHPVVAGRLPGRVPAVPVDAVRGRVPPGLRSRRVVGHVRRLRVWHTARKHESRTVYELVVLERRGQLERKITEFTRRLTGFPSPPPFLDINFHCASVSTPNDIGV